MEDNITTIPALQPENSRNEGNFGKITEQCIAKIKAQAEIFPIVESFITLKKVNATWTTICPFHHEKTPSFHVNISMNLYKCFGCGKGGDAIHFLMEHLKCDFITAIKWIASFYNIPLEYENGTIIGGIPKPKYTKTNISENESEGDKYWEVATTWTLPQLEMIFAKNILQEQRQYFEKQKDKPEATIENIYVSLLKTLERYHCSPLKSFTIIKNGFRHTYAETENFPMFLFDYVSWQKIYKPMEAKKEFRFMYHGKKPADLLNGYTEAAMQWESLKEKEFKSLRDSGQDENEAKTKSEKIKLDEIVLCSGERDSLNVAAMGYFPVWLNSETANLHKGQFVKLKAIAEKVYNLPDIDTTGTRESHALSLQYLDLYTIRLPKHLSERKDPRYGKPCKDIRDYLRLYKSKDFELLVKDALCYKFWEEVPRFDKKGNYQGLDYRVSNLEVYNFLENNGFGRFKMDSAMEKGVFIRSHGNMVKEVPINEIKVFMHEFLKEIHAPRELRNALYRTTQLGDSSLTNISYTDLDFNDRIKEGQYYFFKNCNWYVTKDGIKESPPGSIKKYVWEDDVIDCNVKLEQDYFAVTQDKNTFAFDIVIHDKSCLFFQFLIQTSRVHWQKELEIKLLEQPETERKTYTATHKFNITSTFLDESENEEQKLHLINKIYAIGYLLHRYVDAQKPWCVYAMDNRIGDEGKSYGGSGKSVVFDKAIRKMLKKDFYLNGRNKELTQDKHIYDGLTEHHRYILIDDANEYLDFDYFFAALTGDIKVNPKNQKPYTIGFHRKAKTAITSNFTLRKLDPSTLRRILYTVFSDFYHLNDEGHYREKHEPKDDFGKNLFDDFTEEEYNKFYNTMAQCLKVFLNYDKIEPPLNQVNKKNLLSDMGENFKAWAEVYFSEEGGKQNKLQVRGWAFKDFISSTNVKVTPQKFMSSIKSWCKLKGYELNPKMFCNADGRILRTRKYLDDKGKEKSKTSEMLFIRTQQLTPEQIQSLLSENNESETENNVRETEIHERETENNTDNSTENHNNHLPF